ncbi:pol polyprotein [Tanacetum coccineum]
MTLSETFQVAAIIEKLPPRWVEFKNYLKHKQKEMSVEDLVVHLRIEEDNKLAQKDTYTPNSAKANMVEHAGSSSRSNSKGKGKYKRNNYKKSKGKSEYLAPKAGIMKKKFQETCYNCDQPGHRAANCKMLCQHLRPKRLDLNMWIVYSLDMLRIAKEAIKSEIDSILQNHTWELVDLPPGCKPLGYKWIFKKKMKADGTIDKYKERLVIKGFRQREGLDYFDTYSPVT